MQISLKHNEHGYHTVYSSADAARLKNDGWVICDMEKEIDSKRKHILAAKKKAAKEEVSRLEAAEKAAENK